MKAKYTVAGVLIGIGVLILLRNFNILNFDFDFSDLFLPILFIALGIGFLTGRLGGKRNYVQASESTVMFGEGIDYVDNSIAYQEYSTVFGNRNVHLERVIDGGKTIRVSCVIGQTVVFVPSDLPIIIRGSSMFGSINFPDHSNISFGDRSFNQNVVSGVPAVLINASVVFGEIRFVRIA